jgi:predicted ATP-grasp superfamily ATP-dependent carboligase
VDFVLDEERPQPIEVNPRYPASVELLDFAYREPMLKWHIECADALNTGDDDTEWREPTGFTRHSVIGKAIYYAPHRLTFPVSGPWDDSVRRAADVWRRTDFADVPHPGEVIEAGHPVLTILTEADTEAECLSRLQSRAAELDRLFGFPTPEGESCRP